MVKIIENEVCEYNNTKLKYIGCVQCKGVFGKFGKSVNQSRKTWQIKISELDWDVDFVFQNNLTLCKCGNVIGLKINRDDILIYKQSTEIQY